MKARIHHAFHDCHLCGETVTRAIIISKARVVTICTDCYEAMMRAVDRAKRKDERNLFEA